MIQALNQARLSVLSFFRLALPGIADEACRGVKVGNGIEWPLLNVSQIILGRNVSLGKRGWFYIPARNKTATILIGEGTSIGNGFVISCVRIISICENCLIGFNVSILDHHHKTGKFINPTTIGLSEGNGIFIERNCFIGCNAVILEGVHIGENCVIGANSVVTKSFPAGMTIAGNPARIIGEVK